jgi:hypothetical protein
MKLFKRRKEIVLGHHHIATDVRVNITTSHEENSRGFGYGFD